MKRHDELQALDRAKAERDAKTDRELKLINGGMLAFAWFVGGGAMGLVADLIKNRAAPSVTWGLVGGGLGIVLAIYVHFFLGVSPSEKFEAAVDYVLDGFGLAFGGLYRVFQTVVLTRRNVARYRLARMIVNRRIDNAIDEFLIHANFQRMRLRLRALRDVLRAGSTLASQLWYASGELIGEFRQKIDAIKAGYRRQIVEVAGEKQLDAMTRAAIAAQKASARLAAARARRHGKGQTPKAEPRPRKIKREAARAAAKKGSRKPK